MLHPKLEPGDKVEFVGYPSYLQGLTGEVIRTTNDGELVHTKMRDGRELFISARQFRKQE